MAPMCARYKLITPTGVILEYIEARHGRPNLPARYNIAPTQSAPIVHATPTGRQIATLRWGLIPSWAKDAKIAFSTINARAETVAEKPAFRDALRQRRCLVIADGYYEWKTMSDGKQPYLFARKDAALMAFAGLWERWEKGGEPIETFTIIVTAANALVQSVHDRMPVILDPAYFGAWLDTSNPPADVLPLLKPYEGADLEMTAVSRKLNSVHNEGPDLMDPPQGKGLGTHLSLIPV